MIYLQSRNLCDRCYHLQESCYSVLDQMKKVLYLQSRNFCIYNLEIQNEESNCLIEEIATRGRYK
jgi:hypothetical protein